ncbi:MAG: hypothetical protein ACOCWU_06730, partial [Spirochaetota bacterium]
LTEPLADRPFADRPATASEPCRDGRSRKRINLMKLIKKAPHRKPVVQGFRPRGKRTQGKGGKNPWVNT